MTSPMPVPRLIAALKDARARTLALVKDLSPEQLKGPRLAIVNPPLWEIGHLAWFQEHFVLQRVAGGPLLLAGADALYDSSAIPHDRRWELPLPSLQDTLDYMARVSAAIIGRLSSGRAGAEERARCLLALFHEDMHDEAFIYTRQTLGYAPPDLGASRTGLPADADAGALPGDAAVPGGTFMLGSSPDEPFVFDNEKWAHPISVAPFRIARAPTTNAEFLMFVADGGYRRRELWSEEGWRWRTEVGAEHPAYWVGGPDGWAERRFNGVAPLKPHRPIVHVNWHEAQAWCRSTSRRLPTEAEWEAAAGAEPGAGGGLAQTKRRYPWGDAEPNARRANLDGAALGTIDVAALPESDSAWGCRQMLGNVWEWTASNFEPYPGFAPDAYADYSQPWFGSRQVLRGGAWATRTRMISNTYRNFFTPDRRDILAGFRSCAQ